MIKVFLGYVSEQPSQSYDETIQRFAEESKLYLKMAEFEAAGYKLSRESDGLYPSGTLFYAWFNNDADAVIFKLTQL